jgi:hypothetical protein
VDFLAAVQAVEKYRGRQTPDVAIPQAIRDALARSVQTRGYIRCEAVTGRGRRLDLCALRLEIPRFRDSPGTDVSPAGR